MPSEFAFFVNDKLRFAEPMKSIQCAAISKNTGHPCRRQTVIGSPFCWSHLLSDHSLRIRESTIPNSGKGLFVEKKAPRTGEQEGRRVPVYRKDDLVVPYAGELIDEATLNQRYGEYTAPYGIQIGPNRYEDAAMQRGVGSVINHRPRSQSNVEFKIRGPLHNKRIAIVAKRNLYDGDELFVNYGREYQFREPTRYTVRYRRPLHPSSTRRGRTTRHRR